MILAEFIRNIHEVEDEFIIFRKHDLDIGSEIVLIHESVMDQTVIVKDGVECHYLLEVDLAKDFVRDWKNSISFIPTDEQIAQRIFQYAINDA